MGCWAGTCGISNLPIIAGTPIRVAIIVGHDYKLGDLVRNPKTWRPDAELEFVDEAGVRHPYMADGRTLVPESSAAKDANDRWREGWYSGYCSSQDIFFPRCVPIKGKYDDYGGIEDLEPSLNLQAVMDQFKLDLDEYPAGRFNIPVKISRDMPLDELLDAIERGGVTVNRYKDDRHQRSLPVGTWMVREDIYQALLKINLADRWSDKTFKLDSLLADADEYRQELAEQAVKKPFPGEAQDIMDSLRGMINRGSKNRLRQAMHAPPFENGLDFYDKWMLDQVRSGKISADGPELASLLREIAEFSFFCIAKESMRVGWMPQPGAGSQDDRIEAHAAVAKQTLKTIELMRAEWAQSVDEDE